jgi:hypothetical protein
MSVDITPLPGGAARNSTKLGIFANPLPAALADGVCQGVTFRPFCRANGRS